MGFKYYSHRTDRGESYALDKVEKMRLISRAVSMRREVLVEVQWAERAEVRPSLPPLNSPLEDGWLEDGVH